jgi:hypothetical protein
MEDNAYENEIETLEKEFEQIEKDDDIEETTFERFTSYVLVGSKSELKSCA